MKKNTKSVSRGPGRPQYEIKWPKGKWTFTDLEIENGVNPKTGKGKFCTTLTLRKGVKRELARRGHSAIVLLKGVLADPNSKSGLGRKQLVYSRRTGATIPAATKPARKSTPKTADVSVNVGVSQATVDYEAQKAALLAPTPAVTIAPDPTPAPVAEVTPTPEPVTETAPAPEAIAAETAQVAAEATAEPVTA